MQWLAIKKEKPIKQRSIESLVVNCNLPSQRAKHILEMIEDESSMWIKVLLDRSVNRVEV